MKCFIKIGTLGRKKLGQHWCNLKDNISNVSAKNWTYLGQLDTKELAFSVHSAPMAIADQTNNFHRFCSTLALIRVGLSVGRSLTNPSRSGVTKGEGRGPDRPG